MRRGRGRDRGRGGGPLPPPALVVVADLDDTLRGLVIGAGGATVKATQKLTTARVQTPRRGEAGPVTISGDTAVSVLHACYLIGQQTKASSACVCTVPGLGKLAATLHATDVDDLSRRLLFEATASAGGTSAFVAYVLPPLLSSRELAQMVDDLLFSLGTPPDGSYGQLEGLAGGPLFIFGYGPGTQIAEALFQKLATQVYTPEAAAARASQWTAAGSSAAQGASGAASEGTTGEAPTLRAAASPLTEMSDLFERGDESTVVPCASAMDLLATFPALPAAGELHMVANPSFDQVPLPFIASGWTFACAHWCASGPGVPAWTGCPAGASPSLVRGGRVPNVLCFRFDG